jgi:hypothetical protein
MNGEKGATLFSVKRTRLGPRSQKRTVPFPGPRKWLESYGLPPDRLLIDKARDLREYLGRFNEMDIALDTWPFDKITATCDGLGMGVPCVV